MRDNSFKRPLLYLLMGSVILGAVLGIVIVVRGDWSWLEVRVLLTTIVLAVASLCGLAADMSRTPRGLNLLPMTSLGLTLVGTVLLLIGIWGDLDEEWFWKSTACISVFAVATVHASLLSIARLARKFAWVYFVACQVIYGVAALIAILIIWEVDDERMYRFLAALAIVDVAFTLLIPLLHRVSRLEGQTEATPMEERNVLAIDQEIASLQRRIEHLEKLKSELTKGTVERDSQSEPANLHTNAGK